MTSRTQRKANNYRMGIKTEKEEIEYTFVDFQFKGFCDRVIKVGKGFLDDLFDVVHVWRRR